MGHQPPKGPNCSLPALVNPLAGDTHGYRIWVEHPSKVGMQKHRLDLQVLGGIILTLERGLKEQCEACPRFD